MRNKIIKITSAVVMASMLIGTLTGCGSSDYVKPPAVANPDMSQTEFSVFSSMSALSGGYDGNPVLDKMQEKAGLKIK